MRAVFYIVFAAIAAFVLWTILTGHDEPKPAETFKPKDDRFAETKTEIVKPNLLGQFEKQDITIPKDITVKDIDQVITIFERDEPPEDPLEGGKRKIDVIIDKQGRVFVENKLVDSIRIRKYEEALFGFKQEIGVGASIGGDGRIEPSISYAFFHAKKLKIPVIEAGYRSCGIGIQYPITGRLNAGLFAAREYKDLRKNYLKASITLNF